MDFISNFIKGIAIGIGAIVPGVSGGALALIFGIFERLTFAIANITKDFKKNVIFFFPIGLGGIVGVLVFSRVMNYLLNNYEVEVKYLLIGLIIGTFPLVIKEANRHGFKIKYLIPFVITLVTTVLFAILENQVINVIPEGNPGLIQLMVYGAIMGFGTIVPGISASFILMYIGAYQILLDAISTINITVLIPTGMGFGLSIILFANIVALLLKKAYGYTYYAILGFVIASIIPVFPGIAFSYKHLISLLLLVGGFYLSFYLIKYSNDR